MIIPADSVGLEHYSLVELITLKERIEKRLPNVNSLNLQEELVLQFTSAKELLTSARSDTDTPLNQLAQIINSASAILKQLASIQIELYSAEQNRMLELTLIDLLKEADEEDRTAFMLEYKKRLEALE